jgi:hypothetical protein
MTRQPPLLCRSWRKGIFRPEPAPVVPRPAPYPGEADERLARPGERFLTRRQLAAIYPDAGEGWDARNLPREGRRM